MTSAYGDDEVGAYAHDFSVSAEAHFVAEAEEDVLQAYPAD